MAKATSKPAPDAAPEKATSKPAPDAAPKSDVLYICTRHVNHNNTDYEQGDAIELTDKQAESLLDCGAVEVKPE